MAVRFLGVVRFVASAVMAALFLTIAFAPVSAQQSVSDSIATAKQQLIECFDLTSQAEAAGANVSSLTASLNNVGTLLSQSELAYMEGDFELSQNLSFQCINRLANLLSESLETRNSAISEMSIQSLYRVLFSIFGTSIVLLAGYSIWRFLMRRYLQVEVVAD